jgi:hypothetical protein
MSHLEMKTVRRFAASSRSPRAARRHPQPTRGADAQHHGREALVALRLASSERKPAKGRAAEERATEVGSAASTKVASRSSSRMLPCST